MKCQHCNTDIYYYGIVGNGDKLYLANSSETATVLDFFCANNLKLKHKAMPLVGVSND